MVLEFPFSSDSWAGLPRQQLLEAGSPLPFTFGEFLRQQPSSKIRDEYLVIVVPVGKKRLRYLRLEFLALSNRATTRVAFPGCEICGVIRDVQLAIRLSNHR